MRSCFGAHPLLLFVLCGAAALGSAQKANAWVPIVDDIKTVVDDTEECFGDVVYKIFAKETLKEAKRGVNELLDRTDKILEERIKQAKDAGNDGIAKANEALKDRIKQARESLGGLIEKVFLEADKRIELIGFKLTEFRVDFFKSLKTEREAIVKDLQKATDEFYKAIDRESDKLINGMGHAVSRLEEMFRKGVQDDLPERLNLILANTNFATDGLLYAQPQTTLQYKPSGLYRFLFVGKGYDTNFEVKIHVAGTDGKLVEVTPPAKPEKVDQEGIRTTMPNAVLFDLPARHFAPWFGTTTQEWVEVVVEFKPKDMKKNKPEVVNRRLLLPPRFPVREYKLTLGAGNSGKVVQVPINPRLYIEEGDLLAFQLGRSLTEPTDALTLAERRGQLRKLHDTRLPYGTHFVDVDRENAAFTLEVTWYTGQTVTLSKSESTAKFGRLRCVPEFDGGGRASRLRIDVGELESK